MRKIFAIICCMILMCGCGEVPEKSDKLSIVCTVFPEYDWVREITNGHEENFEITYLLSNGSDMHSYQPTVDDMIKISSCDLFIYIGGESDKWTKDAIKQAKNKDLKTISLLDSLGSSVKEEEHKEVCRIPMKKTMTTKNKQNTTNIYGYPLKMPKHFAIALQKKYILLTRKIKLIIRII